MANWAHGVQEAPRDLGVVWLGFRVAGVEEIRGGNFERAKGSFWLASRGRGGLGLIYDNPKGFLWMRTSEVVLE